MIQVIEMTPKQIDLVQTTFRQVVTNVDEAAGRFYAHLFALAPELRPLFTSNMHHQGDKFLAALAIMIFNLDREWPGGVPPFIQHLGLRHAHHGIPHTAYAVAWQALLQTLAEMLGAQFTPEVEKAWERLFACLTNAMKTDEAATAAH